jgi:hypothetical protein
MNNEPNIDALGDRMFAPVIDGRVDTPKRVTPTAPRIESTPPPPSVFNKAQFRSLSVSTGKFAILASFSSEPELIYTRVNDRGLADRIMERVVREYPNAVVRVAEGE